jgi:Tfp pilus assembly protein PilV
MSDAIVKPESPGATTPRRDGGFSFVETIVTVVLLAIVIVPLMSSVISSIRVSTLSRSAAQAETALINAADRINRAPLECNYQNYASAAVQMEGWDAGRAVVTQEYYDRQTNDWVMEGSTELCPGAPGPNITADVVQKVTIVITTPDDQISRTIQVVKSNV